MTWTDEQQTAALKDGWGIFDNADYGLRIERYDDAGRFDCDIAAQAYVAVRAVRENGLARHAWMFLAWHHAVWDAAYA
jgi:hypothetical protein